MPLASFTPMAANAWVAVTQAVLYACLLAPALLSGRASMHPPSCRWALLGAILVAAGSFALYLPPVPLFRIDSWNWQGKLLQSAIALAVVPMIGARDVFGNGGVRQWLSAPSMLLFLIILVLGIASHWLFANGSSERHRLIYQLTMPGLAEEIFYRGALLAVTYRALGETSTQRLRFMPYIAIGVLFCTSHGLYPEDGQLVFDPLNMVSPALIGSLLGALRYKARSVGPCIVAHNIFNAV